VNTKLAVFDSLAYRREGKCRNEPGNVDHQLRLLVRFWKYQRYLDQLTEFRPIYAASVHSLPPPTPTISPSVGVINSGRSILALLTRVLTR
jgi:hypothetical protein